MGEPRQHVGLVVREVLSPDLGPVGRPLGVGWQRVIGNHKVAVKRDVVVLAEMAAAIVAVVRIAVVREVHRDDRREVGRLVCRNLE